MKRFRASVILLLALAIYGGGSLLQAQNLLDEALAWFPPQTLSLQFSRPSELRSLPNYQSLRARYLGRSLQTLEQSLANLGIHEQDIDSMVFGWQPAGAKETQYEGLATGRFDVGTLSERAAAAGITAHPVGDAKAYCLKQDPNNTCVTILSDSLGVFGSLPALESMIKAKNAQEPSISSNTQFTNLVHSAESDAPIWGVALGAAVSKWFKAWMPGEKNVRMDWTSAFKGVNALSYQIQAGDNVHLNVKLECDSQQAASSVRQLLEGLKLVQQIAWQSSNPGQPNPFQDLQVEGDERQVSFRLTADYAALERVGPLGKP